MAGAAAKYKGEHNVDDWLLNRVVNDVIDDDLDSFAIHLRVPESAYSSITPAKKKKFKVGD